MRFTMLRGMATAATCAAMVAGVAVFVSAPAAQAAYSDCPQESGYFCFWPNNNYSGNMGKVSGTNYNWGTFTGGCSAASRWNDCASSVANEGLSCDVVVYSDINKGGDNFVIGRDDRIPALSAWARPSGGTWDNAISSNSWFCG